MPSAKTSSSILIFCPHLFCLGVKSSRITITQFPIYVCRKCLIAWHSSYFIYLKQLVSYLSTANKPILFMSHKYYEPNRIKSWMGWQIYIVLYQKLSGKFRIVRVHWLFAINESILINIHQAANWNIYVQNWPLLYGSTFFNKFLWINRTW